MNQISISLPLLLLVIIVAVSLSISGCESDPILSPQVEVEEDAGGSYGNTNLPVSTTQKSDNVMTSRQKQNIKSNHRSNANPKLF